MTKPTILVTGATGKTGSAVVARLREMDYPVRAVVHSHDARSEQLRQLGAEIVAADLFDYEQMVRAVRGTKRACYCPPFHPQMLHSAAVFCDAVREAKLEAVVGLGQWLASPDHPSIHTRQVWLAGRMLAALPGVAFVNVNTGYFADNYLRLLDFASLLRVFPVLTGDSRNAPASNEDIGRVAAALLADPDRHAGKSYRATGPELLSAYEMVAVIRRVLGHGVLAANMPFWMFERAARLQGVPAFEIANFRYYVEDHKQGAFERAAPNDVVLELTGRPAEAFETTVWRYAAMPFARKTLLNRLRAFVNFNRVPFSRGYNLRRYEREQSFPVPAVPRYAMGNDDWKAGHGAMTALFPRGDVDAGTGGTPTPAFPPNDAA